MPDADRTTERTIHRHIEREHRDVLAGIDACASAVARSWDGERTEDGPAIRAGLRAELERADLFGELSSVLAESVSAAGLALPASPVPAPPYLVVTSRGPLVRATTDAGRLVIRFGAFDVDRDDGAAYRRLDGVDLSVALE